jgi:hypothetical protein
VAVRRHLYAAFDSGSAIEHFKLRHYLGFAGLAMFAGVWQAGGMKKQASDQAFHDRRHQERKRAEAERKVPKKKVAAEKPSSESRVPGAES